MQVKTTFARQLTGSLADELARVQKDVRGAPGDDKLRTYLFQLLVLQGKWQRALEQLQMCAQLSAKALPMAQMYREAIRCELYRAEVFAGKRAPQVLGEPPEWIGPLIEALQRLAKGDAKGAQGLREAAFEAAPASAGSIDDHAFEWIADADSRLGPVCEAMVNGQYYWVPFYRIRTLRIEPPADLRDLVWLSAHLTLANGGEHIALLPARYSGSEAADNDALKLGRRTEWTDAGGEAFVGLGQKMIATDAGEYAMLDVRQVDIAQA
jgi:type VI secretion system protein ImpE